jgi:hypothetical protein
MGALFHASDSLLVRFELGFDSFQAANDLIDALTQVV